MKTEKSSYAGTVFFVFGQAGKNYAFFANKHPASVKQITDGAYELALSSGESIISICKAIEKA